MEPRRVLHALAFGAVVAAAAAGVFLAALLVTRPRDLATVTQNLTPTGTATATAGATATVTPNLTTTARAIATATPTPAPPTVTPTRTPLPTETPAPTSSPPPPATNTPQPAPTGSPSAAARPARSPAAEPFCVPTPSVAEFQVAPGQVQSYLVTFAGACWAHPHIIVDNSFGMSLTIHRPDGGREGPWEIPEVLDFGAWPFQQGTSSLAFAHVPAPQCVVACSARVAITWLPHE